MDNEIVFLFILMVLVGSLLIYSYIQYQNSNRINEAYYGIMLKSFVDMDCKQKGDMILSQYMDKNQTLVSKMLPVFKDADCQFDVATKIIMKSP